MLVMPAFAGSSPGRSRDPESPGHRLICQRYSRPSGGNQRTTSTVSRAGSRPDTLARTASPGDTEVGGLTRRLALPATLTVTPLSVSRPALIKR